MKTLAFIQARLASTRFPEKVMARLGYKTVLEWSYDAAIAALGKRNVYVLTCDRMIEISCAARGMQCFRWSGDPEDVLGRFQAATAALKPEIIVRLTADNPFVPVAHIKACAAFAELYEYAWVGPRQGFPDGFDVQAFTPLYMSQHGHREHVISPDAVPQLQISFVPSRASERLTLDTPEDLVKLQEIARNLE